ncbi:hypothetical protein [Brevibacillus panacihumi]|uniref:hypothetical protein n=1 Tax=Brevibacillus panacihumi TaxID=497735 RepID=UPI003D1B44E1
MKKLFAFNVYINGAIRKKSDEQFLRRTLPTGPAHPKYVWAETETEALVLAKEHCDDVLRRNTEWGLISPGLDVEFSPVIVGESAIVEQVGEPITVFGAEVRRRLIVTFKPRMAALDANHDVINTKDEEGVRIVEGDELAEMLRQTFHIVH